MNENEVPSASEMRGVLDDLDAGSVELKDNIGELQLERYREKRDSDEE